MRCPDAGGAGVAAEPVRELYRLADAMFLRGMAVDVFFSQDLELFLKTRGSGVRDALVYIDELE